LIFLAGGTPLSVTSLILREVKPKIMAQDDGRARDGAHAEPAAQQAERCRRLSRATYDRATSEMLSRLAEDFERRARSGPQE
jgi:hypothetical protein